MTTQNSIRRILIPASGFGTRVGSPPAKELLPDPENGKPLIKFSLDIAETVDAQAVVITRKNKLILIDALRHYANVEICLIDSSKEWPDTLLQSEPYWGENNVVLLPDTRFSPLNTVEQIFSNLESGKKIVFATFAVNDFSTWGVVARNKSSWHICEKPSNRECLSVETLQAWGIFGFKREFGKELLNAMLQSGFDHRMKPIDSSVDLLHLETFQDLTR